MQSEELVELACVRTVLGVWCREFAGIGRIPMDFPVESASNNGEVFIVRHGSVSQNQGSNR